MPNDSHPSSGPGHRGQAHTASGALSVRGLNFHYAEQQVLRNVQFQLVSGQFAVLLGPNGAGKSTLFALLTGLYHCASGDIAICSASLNRDPRQALAQLGVVFQQTTLDLDLSVEQNLRYYAALQGMSVKTAAPMIEAELRRLGLWSRKAVVVRQLNGGHRRRLEIARALLHRPSILLLDEPTVGLDIASRQFIVDYAHQLCRERALTVLWSTHLLDEVGEGDTVIVLDQGRIKATGTPASLRQQTRSESLLQAYRALTAQTPR